MQSLTSTGPWGGGRGGKEGGGKEDRGGDHSGTCCVTCKVQVGGWIVREPHVGMNSKREWAERWVRC